MAKKRLYVGNLNFRITVEELAEAFGQTPGDVTLPMRPEGGIKGFGFIDVPEEDAEALIEKWNGQELAGRALTVNEARPREERPRDGGYNRSYDRAA